MNVLDRNKAINEKELNNARELAEMYLCSSILKEIYDTIKKAIKTEREIPTLLSQKTGKPLNSVYRDKNTLTVYNTSSFFRYWIAMLEICEEMNVSKDIIPNINDILSRYQKCIYFISHITDGIDLNSVIEHNTEFVVEMTIYFNQNPLPKEKRRAKQPILNKIMEHPKIKEKILKKQQADLIKRKEGMMKVD